MKKRARTLIEAEVEIRRLNKALDNVHACLQAASLALRNAGIHPYPGRIAATETSPEAKK